MAKSFADPARLLRGTLGGTKIPTLRAKPKNAAPPPASDIKVCLRVLVYLVMYDSG